MKEKLQSLTASMKLTGVLLNIVQKILNIKFEITGEENIPKEKSILFCANHFTRFETFIVPYILNKISGLNYTRSLAYKTLFFGRFGDYLRSMKALSTDDANRDETIIDDLVHKTYNWMIYPEGYMVKDKKIFTSKPTFFQKFKALKMSAKTGAATLAMRAEFKATNKNEIYICPITISYRPIHAKRNTLYSLIKTFVNQKVLSKNIKEEMFFESSLLAHSIISIHFHKPVCVGEYIAQSARFLKFTPLSKPKKEEIVLEYLRYPLTNRMMHIIYLGTPLTFDHFFSFAVFSLVKANRLEVEVSYLRELLFNYIATGIIFNSTKFKSRLTISTSINQWNIPKLILENEVFAMLQFGMRELELKGLGSLKGKKLFLDAEKLLEEQDFNSIRLKNIFKVLLNEFSYFKRLNIELEKTVLRPLPELKQENGEFLKTLIEIDYKEDRKTKGTELKPEEAGMPALLKGGEVGVLLCHGFKASPAEMMELAKFLNSKGFTVYNLRLKGHGTTPEDMKEAKAEDWLYSYKIGYEILKRSTKEQFLCGFSMGGLLTLINTQKLNPKGIIAISAPLKLIDFKFNFVGIMNDFSELITTFTKNIKDFIVTKSERPETNYEKVYFSSLEELKKVIKMGESELKNVKVRALIIQGREDTKVDAKSAINIYQQIQSTSKELYEPNFGPKHIIVNGEGSEQVFEKILQFLNSK